VSEFETFAIRDLEAIDLGWMAERESEIFGPSAWSRTLIGEDFASGMRRYRGIALAPGAALEGYAVYGFDGDAFHLLNLAVAPRSRRRGLGRALLEDALAEARRIGAREIWLEVAANNEAAIALYREYGFEDVRIRRRYYQPEDVDAIVMRLAL
jgi:ribosomal-protein-alanine N-acetyltransferase